MGAPRPVLIPAGLIFPRVAVFGYLVIAVLLILPFELFRRRPTTGEG